MVWAGGCIEAKSMMRTRVGLCGAAAAAAARAAKCGQANVPVPTLEICVEAREVES